MAFAQLTWRESLRDIEASLSANSSKQRWLLENYPELVTVAVSAH